MNPNDWVKIVKCCTYSRITYAQMSGARAYQTTTPCARLWPLKFSLIGTQIPRPRTRQQKRRRDVAPWTTYNNKTLALVPSTGLGAVTGGGGPAGVDWWWCCCCSSGAAAVMTVAAPATTVDEGGAACSNILWRWASRSMLAKRYAAAALGVYDLGKVGGGVGLATPPPPSQLSPLIITRGPDDGWEINFFSPTRTPANRGRNTRTPHWKRTTTARGVVVLLPVPVMRVVWASDVCTARTRSPHCAGRPTTDR